VRRTHRRGIERLLSLVYVYPFRCQLCRRRFRAMQWGRHYAVRGVDRREFERLPARFPVTILAGSTEAKGVVTDLSIDGCAVEATTPVARERSLSLSMQTTPLETLSIERAIVRTVHGQRLGIQFVQLTDMEHDALERVLRRLLAAAPRPPGPPAPPAPV
jgi:hypothetical protein